MKILPVQTYNLNINNSFRGKTIPVKEQTVSQHIRQHLFENLFYRDPEIFKGNLPEEYMNSMVEKLVPPVLRKKLSEEELKKLENYHIYKIPGTGNSFRGPLAYSGISLLRPMKLRAVIESDSIVDARFTKNIDRIVDFIKAIQKDSVYVGCDFGSDRTVTAMYLNYFLNPVTYYNSEPPHTPPYFGHAGFADLIELYDKFTPEQKAYMGWTEEFEKESRKEAEEARNYYVNY